MVFASGGTRLVPTPARTGVDDGFDGREGRSAVPAEGAVSAVMVFVVSAGIGGGGIGVGCGATVGIAVTGAPAFGGSTWWALMRTHAVPPAKNAKPAAARST